MPRTCETSILGGISKSDTKILGQQPVGNPAWSGLQDHDLLPTLNFEYEVRNNLSYRSLAALTQLVECYSCKVDVVSSILTGGSLRARQPQGNFNLR